MYHWYHSHEYIEMNSPSRADGVDFETETRYRTEGARFIMELGNKLGLRYLPIATGIVFFHRFYMFHSFKEFPRWVTGATCLLLAGKVEETPKKCKDILKYAQQLLDDNKFKTFGENPREEVMVCERVLLQTIKFDLQLNHPYKYLIKYGKILKGDKQKINELVQKAWIFINDSLSTTLCLIYKPQVVALAVLLLAVKLTNQNIRDFISSKSYHEWWKLFYAEASETELEEICKELTTMYEGKAPRRRIHNNSIDKKKGSDSATSSPQLSSSPKPKKHRISTPTPSISLSTYISSTTTSVMTTMTATTTTTLSYNVAENTHVNNISKRDLTEASSSKSNTNLTETSNDNKDTSSKRSPGKRGSQTPEEMDVGNSPLEAQQTQEIQPEPEKRPPKLEHVSYQRSKSKDQPVTLQQVQAQHQKLLQKHTHKQVVQKQLTQKELLKQHIHSKLLSTSPPHKMPKLKPIKQSTIIQHENSIGTLQKSSDPPPLKPLTPKISVATPKKHVEPSPQKQTLSTPVQVKSTTTPQLHKKSSAVAVSQTQEPVKTPQHTKQSHNNQHQESVVRHTVPQQHQHSQKHQQNQLHKSQIYQPTSLSDSPLREQSNHNSSYASTPPKITESAQAAAAPILDHMSSFFQSNQAYNYPTQNYSHQQNYAAAPPFPPQPTLPQGLPQPPGFPHQSYMGSGQQMNHYLDTSSQQSYYTNSNYSSSQPPMIMQPPSGHHPMPPPPSMFHSTPWM